MQSQFPLLFDGISCRFYVANPIIDARRGVEVGKMRKIVAQKCNKTRKRGPLDYLLTPSNPQKNLAKPPEPPWLSSNCASMNPIHISFLLICKQARQVTNCFFKVSHSTVSAKMICIHATSDRTHEFFLKKVLYR